jgi:formiminotetrahydrofolate cyclodeaminase
LDDIKSEYNEVRTGIVGINLEKIKDEELKSFYKDIERVKKILQKWNS